MLFSSVFLACMGNKSTTITTESGTSISIHGTIPTETIPLPEFIAHNHDGAERTAADLVGHPTVIWFYPVANTAG
jgi:peroxiredoxin